MAIRFDDIGNRLKAFRLGSGLSADEIARRIGISRTGLYRFEKGEVAKIEALEKLADLLGVSVPTLLGVGVEYISSAVSFFERLRQIEERADRIIVLAGPVSFLLASDSFDETLEELLAESIPPADGPNETQARGRAMSQLSQLMDILRRRKETFHQRRPGVLNLISGVEIDRFLRNGLVGRLDLPDDIRADRRRRARDEAEHLARLMEAEPIGVQIGVVPGALPHTSFQIFREADRRILALSPFRLGEQPNIHAGIAMITAAPEALDLHEKAAEDMWRRAHKGPDAARFLRGLIERRSGA